MAGQLKIRSAEPNDFDEIIDLFESWAPDNWDSGYAKRYYQNYFDNLYPVDEVFVGTIDNKVVGVTGYCPDPEETGGIYWLDWFYVHRDITKHGYGGQLLDHVIGILKNKKARKLYVNTASSRLYKPARKLYKDKGFEEEGVLKDFYEKGEHQIIFGMQFK